MTKQQNDKRGDMITAEAFSVEELRAAVFGGSERVSPEIALMLLSKKDYPEKEKLEDMRRVLLDKQADRRLRQTAAVEIGRTRLPEAMPILIEALNEPEAGVVRSALEGLSLHGSAEALEAIEKLRDRTDIDVREPARNLARLLRYRRSFSGEGYSLPGESAFIPVDPQRARPITAARANETEVNTALVDLHNVIPDVPLIAEGATRLQCVGRDFLFLRRVDPENTPQKIQTIEGKLLVGVLALFDSVEANAWTPHYYVLAQPGQDKNELHVFVTSPRGTLELAGIAMLRPNGATFSVRSVDRAGAVPIAIEGTLNPEELRIEQGLSELHSPRKQSPTPLRREVKSSST